MRFGVSLFIQIPHGETTIGDRQTAPDHFTADIQPGRYLANRNHPAVGVDRLLFTCQGSAVYQVTQGFSRFDTTTKTAAGLVALEGVNAEQADMSLADHQRIAVDNIRHTRNDLWFRQRRQRHNTERHTDGNPM